MRKFSECKKVKRRKRTITIDGKKIVMEPYDLQHCKRNCIDYESCNAKTNLEAKEAAMKSLMKE